MHFADVAMCFSRTQYIAAFESKFSYAGAGGGCSARRARAKAQLLLA